MSEIKEPQTIRTILSMENLSIPGYQRPYKWKMKNVRNLIMDIELEQSAFGDKQKKDPKYKYRIGSVILHKENNNYNIVDGQQRLLTISLILSQLLPQDNLKDFSLYSHKFSNKITLDNLKYNSENIKKILTVWNDDKKKSFANFLLDNCEMIIIETDNIAEAFQLFDSQNARGKTLEPADLLKAYHLRAMTDENEKKMCVLRWENAIDKNTLHPILSEIIYRCRCWLKQDYYKYYFSNDYLDEFKGVNLDLFSQEKILPFMQRLYISSQFSNYSLDEEIVDGKRFFDYVDHYISLYEKLFPAIGDSKINNKRNQKYINDNLFQELIRSNCFYTPKMHRTGDKRLLNVLYCLLLSYYDRFGDKAYKEFFDLAYHFVYQLRFELPSIKEPSVRDHIIRAQTSSISPFKWIHESYKAQPADLMAKLTLKNININTSSLNSNVKGK